MKTVEDMILATSLDTMVNIVNNDEEHIRRAKAKAKLVKEEIRKADVRELKRSVSSAKKDSSGVILDKREIEANARLAVLITAIATFSQVIANSV